MTRALAVPVQAEDGHRFELIGRMPAQPRAQLLWLPALVDGLAKSVPYAPTMVNRLSTNYVEPCG